MGQGRRKAVGFTPKELERRKHKDERNKRRRKEREAGVPGQQPRTIESTRVWDDSRLTADDKELAGEDGLDEFANVLVNGQNPNILLTTSAKVSAMGLRFVNELLSVFPLALYRPRRNYGISEIVDMAKARSITAVVVVEESRPHRPPDRLHVIIVPDGPTVYFRISSIRLRKSISGHGLPTSHWPELITTNFQTRLGHRIARCLSALFPQKPEYEGRRVVTFHNQRDFIFFRHHRYIFDSPEKARIQELGPRFTLRLLSVQLGAFDPKNAEFEWTVTRDYNEHWRQYAL